MNALAVDGPRGGSNEPRADPAGHTRAELARSPSLYPSLYASSVVRETPFQSNELLALAALSARATVVRETAFQSNELRPLAALSARPTIGTDR